MWFMNQSISCAIIRFQTAELLYHKPQFQKLPFKKRSGGKSVCGNYSWRKEFHLPLPEKWLETSETIETSDNYVEQKYIQCMQHASGKGIPISYSRHSCRKTLLVHRFFVCLFVFLLTVTETLFKSSSGTQCIILCCADSPERTNCDHETSLLNIWNTYYVQLFPLNNSSSLSDMICTLLCPGLC